MADVKGSNAADSSTSASPKPDIEKVGTPIRPGNKGRLRRTNMNGSVPELLVVRKAK
jgi:hypothetical protein